MKNQLQNKEDQFKDLENIVKKGWEHNEKAFKEIQNKEMENIKLKLELENEKKISQMENQHKAVSIKPYKTFLSKFSFLKSDYYLGNFKV